MKKKEITKINNKLNNSDENKLDKKVENKVSIISPRLTEKASRMSNKNIYTFNVINTATKINLAKEIVTTYKVKPIKITIINNPRTAVLVRGKHGFKSGFKKASVFLKKGDKINFA